MLPRQGGMCLIPGLELGSQMPCGVAKKKKNETGWYGNRALAETENLALTVGTDLDHSSNSKASLFEP